MKKFNFRKISAIAGSLLLTGLTLGGAAAATYPAPFVSGGSANVAIVYGAGALPQDAVTGAAIQIDLQDYETLSGSNSGSAATGGDYYLLEKSSTKFNLGDYAGNVVSSTINDDNLPTLLADGKYVDDDNDEFDYTQKIELNSASLQLVMFDDNDYKADAPTVGIKIANGANVMNYTLDMTADPLWEDLVSTDIPFMGKNYYVLSTSGNDTINLLDSADDTILAQGESVTVSGKDVSITFISSTEVILNVDGVDTTTLSEGETAKLSGGSYVGIKDILFDTKEAGISKVEFSIGNGKLELVNGSDVKMNEDTISDLGVTITNSVSDTKLASIKITWDADDELFIAEDSEILMPGFEAVKMTFGGLTYPLEETFSVEGDGTDSVVLKGFPLKDSTEDINILYYNGTDYTLIGKDSDNQLITSGNTSLRFDGDTDKWFAVSWNDSQDSESYLMRFSAFENTSGLQRADVQYRANGDWANVKVDAQPGDSITLGNVEFTVSSLDKDTKVAVIHLNSTDSKSFRTLYTKEGMMVSLPWINTTQETVAATMVDGQLGWVNGSLNNHTYSARYNLLMNEEDRNGNLGKGNLINISLAETASNDEVQVSLVDMGTDEGTFSEVGSSTKIWRNFAYSELATEAIWDKSADQYEVAITYHGEEVKGDVYVTSPEATVTPGNPSGSNVVLVTDAEVSSVATKNLIVVGGSCINSAAATLVGGAYCGAAWTEATNVGTGQFLIKGYADSTLTSKLALLVAGYEAADTTNAKTYLTTKKPDTSSAWIGTSSTEATLQTEAA